MTPATPRSDRGAAPRQPEKRSRSRPRPANPNRGIAHACPPWKTPCLPHRPGRRPFPRARARCPPGSHAPWGVKDRPRPAISAPAIATRLSIHQPVMHAYHLTRQGDERPDLEFLTVLTERGFIHQCSDPEGLDAGAGRWAHGLCGLRLHGPVAARRASAVDHDAALAAADRRQADRPDGRRHDRVGDPSGRDESRGSSPSIRSKGTRTASRHVLALPPLRRWRRRCAHGRQRRVADEAQLHRVPARCRAAFLGQPHAVLRQRCACASSATRSCRSSNSTT